MALCYPLEHLCVDADRCELQDDAPKRKVPAAEKPAKKPAKPREKKEKAAADDGPKPKAKRAKKAKDAPKNALSAFMFFSNANREQVPPHLPASVPDIHETITLFLSPANSYCF